MFGLIFIFYATLNTNFDRVHKFNIYGFVHRKYIPKHTQQDATLHSLFLSGNSSTCFGWYLHLSSGAHTTVSWKSSNSSTIAADGSNGVTNTRCRYRGRVPTLPR